MQERLLFLMIPKLYRLLNGGARKGPLFTVVCFRDFGVVMEQSAVAEK